MKALRKIVTVTLIATLMLSLIPSVSLHAEIAPSIEIVGLYSPDSSAYKNNDINDELKDSSLAYVTRLTSPSITLRGNYYNFDSVQVQNFFYTITSVKPDGKSTTVVYDKNKPAVTSDHEFEFRNVILNEGLNKIVVYSPNGDNSSKAAWVYFYPVVTITDLKVNQEIFKDGAIVPADPLTEGTSLIITGTAPNAESVVIQKLGDSTPYSGYYNSQTGYFQFKVDSTSSRKLADIRLEGGDQQFDIVATNDTQRITLSKRFVYNDGTPFIFENKIASMIDTNNYDPNSLKDLVTQPVLNGTNNSVYLQGNIKIDIDPNNSSLLLYDKATIKIPNQSGSDFVTFSFSDPDTPIIFNKTSTVAATIQKDTYRSTSKYNVYKYTIRNMYINSIKREQQIIADFSNVAGILTKPILKFDYINTALPYISEIRLADSNIAVIDGTQVNELPLKIKLVSDDNTTAAFSDVRMYYDGNIELPDANQTAETHTAYATQKVFTLTNGYNVGDGSLAVLVDGELKRVGVDYIETNSNTVTFTYGLSNQDTVTFLYQSNTIFEKYTATAGQQVFTVETGYEPNKGNLTVFVNGVKQYLGSQYVETNNRTVTFLYALSSGDRVTFVYNTRKIVDNYRASANQTVIPLKTSYTMGNDTLNVYRNGVLQTKNVHYYETNEGTITFRYGLTYNDLITVTYDDKYKISWLPEGVHDLTFIPIDFNGIEQSIGSITRSLVYVPMQYIIVNNIYNGEILESDTQITQLEGRLVNVPSTNSVRVFIGDTLIPFTRNADDTFTADVNGNFVEGKNVITFKIVDEHNDIISESVWEVFLFTTQAPEISMDFIPSLADYFVSTSELQLGQFATREKSVTFKGVFNETSTINLNIYRKTEDGVNQIKQVSWSYPTIADDTHNNSGYSMDFEESSIVSLNGKTAKGNFELSVDLSILGVTTIQVQVTNASGIINSRTYEIRREPMPYEIIYPNLDRSNVVNSDFVRIEMVAEGADEVVFKDGKAWRDSIIDKSGLEVEGYVFEIYDLRPGKNKIKFSVIRGEQKINAEIEITYASANIEGAMSKIPIDKKMDAFDKLVEVTFDNKNVMLRRNDDSTINPYLSNERRILFGIAEDTYGRVDKFRHPIATEKQKDYTDDGDIIDNFYPAITSNARIGQTYLTEPTGRFIPAGPLIWIDAGTLKENADKKADIIYGSGKLPYDKSDIFYERNIKDFIIPTERGEITLRYNDNIRDEAWPYLTIYQFTYNPDKDIYEWLNIGGVVDPKKHTITAPIDSFGYFRVMYMNQSFDDVIGHNWARLDLDTLYSKGIMKNKFSDQFVPEENITRGEFVTLLVKAFELPLNYEGEPTFYDVFKNPHFIGNALYEYKYIETAARYGIIRGRLEGTFAPNDYLARQDAAVMIARAANLKMTSITDERGLERTTKNLQKLFTDANLINLYAMPAVEAVVKAGLMNGKLNVMIQGQTNDTYRFDPTFELKRSEAARIIMNVLKQQKKIP